MTAQVQVTLARHKPPTTSGFGAPENCGLTSMQEVPRTFEGEARSPCVRRSKH